MVRRQKQWWELLGDATWHWRSGDLVHSLPLLNLGFLLWNSLWVFPRSHRCSSKSLLSHRVCWPQVGHMEQASLSTHLPGHWGPGGELVGTCYLALRTHRHLHWPDPIPPEQGLRVPKVPQVMLIQRGDVVDEAASEGLGWSCTPTWLSLGSRCPWL